MASLVLEERTFVGSMAGLLSNMPLTSLNFESNFSIFRSKFLNFSNSIEILAYCASKRWRELSNSAFFPFLERNMLLSIILYFDFFRIKSNSDNCRNDELTKNIVFSLFLHYMVFDKHFSIQSSTTWCTNTLYEFV